MPYADREKDKEYHRKYRAEYYRANKQHWDNYKERWNTENPERMLLQNARGRAKKNGTEFNITLVDVVIPKTCPVLGIEINVLWFKGGDRAPRWSSPSLDRIDPKKGYIRGNVRVISWRANSLKRDGSLDEMRLVLADLERLAEDC